MKKSKKKTSRRNRSEVANLARQFITGGATQDAPKLRSDASARHRIVEEVNAIENLDPNILPDCISAWAAALGREIAELRYKETAAGEREVSLNWIVTAQRTLAETKELAELERERDAAVERLTPSGAVMALFLSRWFATPRRLSWRSSSIPAAIAVFGNEGRSR